MAISGVFSLVTSAFLLAILSAAPVYFWRPQPSCPTKENGRGTKTAADLDFGIYKWVLYIHPTARMR